MPRYFSNQCTPRRLRNGSSHRSSAADYDMKRMGRSHGITTGAKAGAQASQRKIIVYIATSVDGYIARSDGGVDWLNRPLPKGGYGMDAFARSIDTVLW